MSQNIFKKKFKCFRLDYKINLSKYRYTIDIIEDFKLFMSIVENKNFLNLRMIDIINFIDKNPGLVRYQKNIKKFWMESFFKKRQII